MSDDAKCVCGCTWEQHQQREYYSPGDYNDIVQCDAHGCTKHRLALDWPDSEGWWWSDIFGLVEAKKMLSYEGYRLDGYGEDGLREFTTKGRARFTKLLEPNPFTPRT